MLIGSTEAGFHIKCKQAHVMQGKLNATPLQSPSTLTHMGKEEACREHEREEEVEKAEVYKGSRRAMKRRKKR